jgi:pimeloyl-ACP methyl ester carboxylesterase
VAKWVGRVLFSKPFRLAAARAQDEQPLAIRFMKGLGYRLLFAPILVAPDGDALVYRGTHRSAWAATGRPRCLACFTRTLEFNGPDGHPLMAWFVPVVDAKRVLELKDKVLRGKQPAVVLVHDYNASPSQMVPLIEPLHGAGFVVSVVGLRGAGRGWGGGADVRAERGQRRARRPAELRKRPTVDAERVAVVGVGTGANAALIAAAQEPGVKAMVLVNAFETPRDAIARHVGPTRPGFAWMQQASKWAFEVAYHVDAEDLNLARFRDVLASRATLTLAAPTGAAIDAACADAIRSFLAETPAPSTPRSRWQPPSADRDTPPRV